MSNSLFKTNLVSTMKKYGKIALIICVLLLLLWVFKSWFKDKIITLLGGYTNKEIVVEKDIRYVKGKIDTLAIFNDYVETKGIILNPEPIIEYRYKYKNPVTSNEEEIDSIKNFNVKINDSLLEGTFHIVNNFKGDLLYTKFNYKPKFPKYITSVDTVETTIIKTEILDNNRPLIGIGTGYTTVENLQIFSLSGSYITKKKLQFIVEYGKSINGIKENINNKEFTRHPSDLFSLKIIKHF